MDGQLTRFRKPAASVPRQMNPAIITFLIAVDDYSKRTNRGRFREVIEPENVF